MISHSNIWKAKAVYSWWCMVMIDDELVGSETPQCLREPSESSKGLRLFLRWLLKFVKSHIDHSNEDITYIVNVVICSKTRMSSSKW